MRLSAWPFFLRVTSWTPDKIASLAERFNLSQLPKSEWTHEAHLVMGLWYLARYPMDEAVEQMAPRIKAHNSSVGTPNSDTEGYHETLTRFWLYLLLEEMSGLDGSIIEPLNRFLDSEKKNAAYTFEWYSRENLFTVQARHGWVPPDVPAQPNFEPIHTDRTQLSPYRLADGEELYRLLVSNKRRLQASFPKLCRLAVAPWAVELWVSRVSLDWSARKRFALAVRCRESSRLLGHLSIWNFKRSGPELAYFLDESATGRGLGTEFMNAGIDYCRENLGMRRLWIRCTEENRNSQKLAKNLGFTLQDRTPNSLVDHKNVRHDSLNFCLEL